MFFLKIILKCPFFLVFIEYYSVFIVYLLDMASMQGWLGMYVKAECRNLGIFEGKVTNIDGNNQIIVLGEGEIMFVNSSFSKRN